MQPPTYPLRPVNGGPLDRALPKTGVWRYEPKYNGWRALVHAPTSAMFNRHGKPLSIAAEFRPALQRLREATAGQIFNGVALEWFDCEGLERRHNLGRGSLILLDWLNPYPHARLAHRRHALLNFDFPELDWLSVPEPDRIYRAPQIFGPDGGERRLWADLKQANAKLGGEFYEGVVAKREDSLYPFQLRSDSQEFPYWMKHRWAF